MNELAWRRQLRNLRQPVTPQRDLLADIDSALDAAASPAVADRRQPSIRRRAWPWLAAAGVVLSLTLAGKLGWQMHAAAPVAARHAAAPSGWQPSDPRLAGAAVELDAARMELLQAMQQSPHSAALRRLLSHTEQQQSQLRHWGREAG